MTSTNEIIRNLSIRLLKAEVAKRNPKDHKAVEDVIAPRVRIDSIGEVYVVTKDGMRDDSTTFEQFLDQVVKDRPDLWQGGTPSSAGKTSGNPFAPAGWNITRQMHLINTDRATAEKLAAEAGVNL